MTRYIVPSFKNHQAHRGPRHPIVKNGFQYYFTLTKHYNIDVCITNNRPGFFDK